MAAFYRLPRCLFYIVGGLHRGRFAIVFVRLPVCSELKKIVHRMSEILLAAKIAFGRLHGYMPQQELNLLKLSAVRGAQLRAGSPQVIRCNMFQARSLAAGLDDVPHHILRDAFSPHLSRPGDGSKDPSLRNPGCLGPLIERHFQPVPPAFSEAWQRLLKAANAEKRFAFLTWRVVVCCPSARLAKGNTSSSNTTALESLQTALLHLFPDEMLASSKRLSVDRGSRF